MYKTLFSMALAAFIVVTGFGQKPNPKAVPEATAGGGTSSRSSSAAGAPLLSAGTNIEAELQSTLDARKSKVGDQVILKTTRAIKQNGETVVPKGTELIGRVTEVQRKTRENAVSRVGVVIDRIRGKGLDAPIGASIVSIAAARANAASEGLFESNAAGTSGATASGGGSAGGGLLGGVGSTVGGVLNTTTQTVGSVATSAVDSVGQTAGPVVRTVSGLQVSSSASGSASGSSTVSAQGKDVRVNKGAAFQLRVDGSARGQE